MRKICILENTIQEYSWGSKSAIPELLDKEPTGKPQAELWMGAHPKAPSKVVDGEKRIPLNEWIDSDPVGILGDSVSARYGNKLPFLFKILAAGKPLSIQAHPNLAQAIEGFKRENSEGIPLDSPVRNYRDDNHKPELICALTPFWALNGLREYQEFEFLMGKLLGNPNLSGLHPLPKELKGVALRDLFELNMNKNEDLKKEDLNEIITNAEALADSHPEFQWILKLNEFYPGDAGILSPLLLNLVQLQPGEAMFFKAGDMHAYLDGLGIELMANSDNVLRGGLTPKHIDVPELMKVVNFEEKEIEVLLPEEISSTEKKYATHADEFSLSVINLSEDGPYVSKNERNIEIVICTEGDARLVESGGELEIARGTSFVVPASVEEYTITGNAKLFKATV